MYSNENTLKKILQKILEYCFILIQNPFGNYAIQTAVDVKNIFNIGLERRKFHTYYQAIFQ